MSECEICGAEDALYITVIEGAKLRTCSRCAQGGKIVQRPKPVQQPRVQAQVKRRRKEMSIVDDFAERIVGARKKMNIRREVLAELVNEKASFLERIERGKSIPNEALASKLEKELGISLLEEESRDEYAPVPKAEKKGLTLGEIVMLKKKEEED
ncbi:TIGR00270 family protein [Candidatus Micrarchaeota archaeon]|nr:MAG: TIGR00270 family protein [Candidatus Micrarchaeota archaeon]